MKKTGRIEVKEHGHGNRVSVPCRPDSERWPSMVVRKIAADSVPHGTSISTNGKYVWGAYDVDKLITLGATADEARRKFKALVSGKMVTLQNLEGK